MKNFIFAVFTTLVLSGVSFAQSNHQVGAWSIYTTSGKLGVNKMALLQTTASMEQRNANGSSQTVKLDVVCKNDRVVALAVEPGFKIDKHLVSYESPVPTVRLRFDSVGMIQVSEDWAVTAGGRSLTPYAQVSQGALNRTWINRLSGTNEMVLTFNEGAQSTFDTRQLSEAMFAAGCSK